MVAYEAVQGPRDRLRLRSTLRQTLASTPLFDTRSFSSALQFVFKEILEESTCSSE